MKTQRTTPFSLRAAGASLTGRRAHNEDAWLVEPGLGLYAVADGLGGYEGGEVASALALHAIARFLALSAADDEVTWPCAPRPGASDVAGRARAAVAAAHAEVQAARVGERAHMGTTVVLMLADRERADRALVAHVGDSRGYRLRGGELHALTTDHSLYEELKRTGVDVGPVEAFAHAHVITKAVGLDLPSAEPDLRSVGLRAGDRYLLCSDGLSGALSEAAIAARLARGALQTVAQELCEAAYAAGSRDNITAVVVEAAPA